MLAIDTSFDAAAEAIELEEEICVVGVEQEVISVPVVVQQAPVVLQPSRPTKRRKTRRGSEQPSSEEERWLTAIESGKLEQVDDELRKIKDPKLMTARQRAMYERSIDKDLAFAATDELNALPSGYKDRDKGKLLSAEELELAQQKSQKRKRMADEKREKDKQKTMDRLLKKQETKVTKVSKNKIVKNIVPVISYRSSMVGTTISYPIDYEMPLANKPTKKPRKTPAVILCAICKHDRKRYNCVKTNLPLCSLKCYRSSMKPRKRKQSDRYWNAKRIHNPLPHSAA